MKKSELIKKLQGPVFSVITPFCKNDLIDFAALERQLKRILDAGGSIIYCMAYNSRYGLLEEREIRDLNRFVIQTVKSISPETLVIVGDPIQCSTRTTIEFAQDAEKAGADIISLIIREKFYTNRQIEKHFERVFQETKIKVLIHEMKFLSGYEDTLVHWPLELLKDLTLHDQVVALKEDAKDDEYTLKLLDAVGKNARIIVSGGGKERWLKLASKKTPSWLNGIGVFEPRLATRFWREYQDNNLTFCQEMIDKIERPFFNKIVSKYGWHLSIKAALEFFEVMSRHERLPLLEISDTEAREVHRVLKSLPIDDFI